MLRNTFLINIAATNFRAAPYREETLNGRLHWVVPVTLIKPQVLAGSQGPLYYPHHEVKKSTKLWDGVPILVRHPRGGGSANRPEVLQSQAVGVIRNATCNGTLKAEAMFDIAKTRQVDSRILENLRLGKKIEISTGLVLDREQAPPGALFGGRPYDATAKNYRPDHVAILPDQRGGVFHRRRMRNLQFR